VIPPRPASGAPQVLTTASGEQVPIGTPGVAGYASDQLLPSGQGTASGDVFNQFKDYTGPQGGTFGGGPSADAEAARKAWESVSGVSGDKLGDTSGWDAGKWDATRRTFGGIGNNDKQTTLDALTSDNPYIKETAQRYAQNNGWGEPAIPTPGKVIPAPGGVDLSATAPEAPLDLYGRQDAATSNRPVMKASDTFASLQEQARQRMATPQLTTPSATVPTAPVPTDPFSQFGALPQAPQGTGAPMAPTFGADVPGNESAVLGSRIISDPVAPTDINPEVAIPYGRPPMDNNPNLGNTSGVPNLAAGFAQHGGFGSQMQSPSAGGAFGGVSGLRKIGQQQNRGTPDSPQNSGLFPGGGLRKITPKPTQSPTGSPMAPGGASLAAY